MSLYKDASLVMIPSAYKDGRLYSMRPIPEYGSEILTQPVDIDTDFNANAGGVIVDANTFTTAGGSSDGIISSSLIQAGKQYRLEIQGTTTSNGFTFGNGGSGSGNEYGTGFGVHYFTAAHQTLWFRQNTAGTTDITTFSIKEVSNIGDFDFTRGSNLAATRVDVNGLIEKGRENLFLHSEDISNAAYAKIGVNATYNQIANPINGSITADKLETNGDANTEHMVRVTNYISTGVKTLSVYVKYINYQYVYLRELANNKYAVYDIQNGVVTREDSASSQISTSIESVGNGWYRLSMTFLVTSIANNLIDVGLSFNDTFFAGSMSAGSEAYFYGFQLEQGLVATDYIETGATTAQAGILEDMPRLDYSGGASCPSLLLEPQRHNKMYQSEYLRVGSGASGAFDWKNTYVTLTSNDATSPDGYQNATKMETTSANGSADSYVGHTASSTNTMSVFVKAGTSSSFSLYHIATGGTAAVTFNLTNGTFTRRDELDSSATITDYGNDWWRITMTYTAGTGNYISRLRVDDIGYVHIFGWQIEEASYPTSYIPTYGSSVTRSTDDTSTLDLSNADLDGEDVTYFLELKNNQDIARDSGATSLRFSSNTSNLGSFRIYRSSSSARQLTIVFQDNNSNFSPHGYEMTSNNPKLVVKRIWATGQIQVFVDGTEVIDAVNKDMNAWYKVDMEGSGSILEIKQLVAFPTALTDSECIALTE